MTGTLGIGLAGAAAFAAPGLETAPASETENPAQAHGVPATDPELRPAVLEALVDPDETPALPSELRA